MGDVPRTFADISKANKLFGYVPSTNIADGLSRFYAWYQKNHS
jgi:UDP-glucuronate 4-epimerase